MVKRLMIPAVCLFLLTALWLPAQAQPHTQARQLTVEPDRTRLYEGEVLTLTVKGSMEIDINLGNLFVPQELNTKYIAVISIWRKCN